jgi:hypothetical protein
VGSLEICHYLLKLFFKCILGTRQYHRVIARVTLVSAYAFEIALDSSVTNASIATSFRRSGLNGTSASRQAWNLDQSVLLKSELSGGFRKDDRHRLSINIDKWSELSAEHVVSYTGVTSSLVITVPRKSGRQRSYKVQW